MESDIERFVNEGNAAESIETETEIDEVPRKNIESAVGRNENRMI